MYILIATHANFCEGLYESYKMIAGPSDRIKTISLTQKGIGDFRARLDKLINELVKQDNILILCDLKGGTPYNESYAFFLKYPNQIKLVSGVNLSMLLSVSINENIKFSEVDAIAVDGGTVGIEKVDNIIENNDDIEF